MKAACFAVLSLSFLTLVASAVPAEEVHPKLKPLSYRIGEWTADVEANGQVVGKSKSSWSWILNSQFMRLESEIDLPDYGYQGKALAVWGWSAEKNAVQVTDFNSNGRTRQYVVKIEEGKITSPGEDGNQLGIVNVVEEFDETGPKSIVGVDADGNAVFKLVNFKKQ